MSTHTESTALREPNHPVPPPAAPPAPALREPPAAPSVVAGRRPSRAKVVFPVLLALALAAGAARWALGRGHESTDDAQVEGRIVNVASRVPGQVVKVLVQDNQLVHAGDVVVELDHSELDARVEVARADTMAAQAGLANAEAQLALTERNAAATLKQAQGGLAQASSGVDSSRAQLEQVKADVASAEARHRLAEIDLERVKTLRQENAIAQAELDNRQAAYDQAKAALDQAKARLDAMKAGITGSSGGLVLAEGRLAAAGTAPQQVQAARAAVELAKARVKQTEAALHVAELNQGYAQVKASVTGRVSRRTVEVGQMVGPERALFALVPPDDVWVVANFKEDQIGEMKEGQPVHVQLDTYPGKELRGHVDSLAGASGARFSLLPPDNASGNFVKVVQRVPVLVRLDDLQGLSLRPGLSAEVTVDTHN